MLPWGSGHGWLVRARRAGGDLTLLVLQCVRGSAQGLWALSAELHRYVLRLRLSKPMGAIPCISDFGVCARIWYWESDVLKNPIQSWGDFENLDRPVAALSLSRLLYSFYFSIIKSQNYAVGTELIVHYFPDLQLFRKTRNGSIKSLFLSVRHGRSKGCRSAKRERTISVLLEL